MAKSKDAAQFDAYAAKFMLPDWTCIRPSGNPMDLKLWKSMLTSEDIKTTQMQLKSVDTCKIFADGKAALVTYTTHDIFEYKGTPKRGHRQVVRHVRKDCRRLEDGSHAPRLRPAGSVHLQLMGHALTDS